MVVKYKIHELAKDFNVKSNVVIDMLAAFSDAPRKSQTSLTTEELNYVFDRLTQAHAVERFDAFFAMKKPEQPKKEAVKDEEKPAQPAEAAKPEEAAKPAEKPAAPAKPAEAAKPAAERPAARPEPRRDGDRRPQADAR
ncbi:MAG: translation initiation factor IF-2, partial [Clostridia bacterium]|nr:translation initiation factor IF-2 [Clostridia bacterium]